MTREHVDVLVVGAGLSGIGAACRLRREAPERSLAVLESRAAMGGTWDLFRYPGVRSDSDMYTLGYSFRPWTSPQAIADGPSIRRYVEDTAREFGVDRLVRYGHRVLRAEFSTERGRWDVEVERTSEAGVETVELSCDFLFSCTGYYRYDHGYEPVLPGRERFTGTVVHPQHWPADLVTAGKRVVVIGSGATAVTIVPAVAGEAEHVTMLQRSPSWMLSLSRRDALADRLRGRLPESVVYPLVRWKNIAAATATFQLSRRAPGFVRRLLRERVAAQLPAGYDVDRDFVPAYDPWDQRLCFVPGGELFKAVRAGKASVVTGAIDTFTETGIRLASGEELPADVVVTATGLDLLFLGGIRLAVDGRGVDPADCVVYKGMMLSGVPNLAFALGYTNASWTLKVDLVSEHVVRLLKLMRRRGDDVVTAAEPPTPERSPLIDLAAGYVRRSQDQLPKQGSTTPWLLHQNYPRDVLLLRHRSPADVGLTFSRAGGRVPVATRG